MSFVALHIQCGMEIKI